MNHHKINVIVIMKHYETSLKVAVDLGYDLTLCTRLEKENENGKTNYFSAKHDHRS